MPGHTFINRTAAGDILGSSFVLAVCNKIVLISAVFSSQIWSVKIHCSNTVAFRLYLVIIVQPLTN
jgi:hypothetical protein